MLSSVMTIGVFPKPFLPCPAYHRALTYFNVLYSDSRFSPVPEIDAGTAIEYKPIGIIHSPSRKTTKIFFLNIYTFIEGAYYELQRRRIRVPPQRQKR